MHTVLLDETCCTLENVRGIGVCHAHQGMIVHFDDLVADLNTRIGTGEC